MTANFDDKLVAINTAIDESKDLRARIDAAIEDFDIETDALLSALQEEQQIIRRNMPIIEAREIAELNEIARDLRELD